ncbi:hypothetical protein EJ02DRAFT_362924 [Clathrospora elynae]|uniref:Uncharacterized protein n=1 Tax=Clathrospora elynae TaxID=706981 RepID=A0A6A5S2A8_9PLEO|nr:hypothetical protein EJ02DRAFT_362924 [Clathrospora elynae]
MLAPRAPSAFVCLRCEAQTIRPWLPAFSRRTSRAKFSASARRRDGADTLEACPQVQPELKITREVPPLNRLRTRKGKVLRETSARLGGLKRLGDDAEILVLREVGDSTAAEAAESPEPELEPLEPIRVPDIHASLQQEGKALPPEEIYQQIASLRPKTDAEPNEPHYVKQTIFAKLKTTLTTSFTQHQLATFYSAAKNVKRGKIYQNVIDSIKGEKGTAKRPVERSQWQPGITSIRQRLPGLDVAIRGPRKSVSKQLLADRILRDAWNLILLEEIEAPGELELFLRPWQITLLEAGENETTLDKIGRTRRAKLDFFRHHNVLRITADKSTAEYTANDVEQALQNTDTGRINLLSYLPLLIVKKGAKDGKLVSMYSEHDFDVVSRLTRTSIEVATDTMLIIRGFDKNAVDEAKRTLTRFLPFKDSATRTFDTQKLDAAKSSSYLLPVFLEDKSLDHTYRNSALGRMSMPIARITEPEDTGIEEQQGETAKKSVKSPRTLHGLVNRVVATVKRPTSDTSKPAEEVGNWTPEPEYKLSAEVGQVLFPLENADPNKAIEAALQRPSQSPFLPTFPGLSSILASPDFTATTRMQTPSLLYDFRPDPEQPNFEPGQTFPSMHIQMRTDRNGAKATLHKLSIGFQHRIHDVLLPDKSADVRFFRYGRLRFKTSHGDKNVQEWTDAVIRNIESGGRLTAPPLRIEIPKWTIPGFPADAKGMRTVTYLFSGIQFRQSVTGHFLGMNVSYSTVQSGKLGAKGGALTAYYNAHSMDGDMLLQDEISIKAFVRGCFEMADKITHASTQTLPVSRLVNPRNENSGRKIKRLGQQAAAFDRVGQFPEQGSD